MREKLKVQVFKEEQNWSYRGIWRVNGRIVRVDIRRDALDFQSRALTHLLQDNGRWSPQAKIPYPLMATLKTVAWGIPRTASANHVPKAIEEVQFEDDVNALLDEAELFLGGPLQLWVLVYRKRPPGFKHRHGVTVYPVYSLDRESLPDPKSVITDRSIDLDGDDEYIEWVGPFPNTGVT